MIICPYFLSKKNKERNLSAPLALQLSSSPFDISDQNFVCCTPKWDEKTNLHGTLSASFISFFIEVALMLVCDYCCFTYSFVPSYYSNNYNQSSYCLLPSFPFVFVSALKMSFPPVCPYPLCPILMLYFEKLLVLLGFVIYFGFYSIKL